METNKYDVTALDGRYFRASRQRHARRRFFNVLRAEKELWMRLTALHFGTYRRNFTPRQYELVIDTLGAPEEAEDSFGEWPR